MQMAWEWDIRIVFEYDNRLLYFLTLVGLILTFVVTSFSLVEIVGVFLAFPLALGYCALLAGEIKYIDVADQTSDTTCAGFVIIWIIMDLVFMGLGVLGSWYLDPLLILLWYLCLFFYPVSIAVHSFFGAASAILLVIGFAIMLLSAKFLLFLPHLWLLGSFVFVFGMLFAGDSSPF